MATEDKDVEKKNPFKALPMTAKCTECPFQNNAGQECWQGPNGGTHCIAHPKNAVKGSTMANAINDYKIAMQKALQHDSLKQDNADAIVAWQLQEGSLKNNCLIKAVSKVFG